MKTEKPVFIIALVCMLLGIMISIQFRANLKSPGSLSVDRWSELTVQLDHLRQQNASLSQEVINLREKLMRGFSSSTIKEEANKYGLAAGVTHVKGTGIIVTLRDNADLPLSAGNPDDLIVHDWQLLFLVNELRAAGAEAISINGERMVSASEIRCAGTNVLINMNRVFSPFEIRAIGDPESLESALRIRGGEYDALTLSGIDVKIDKRSIVEIPAFKGDMKYKYAQPDYRQKGGL